MKKVSVRTVADYAGVAVGTVSRVLNSNETVNPKLRQRVEEAIRRLNYTPSVGRTKIDPGSPVISFVLSNRQLLHPVHAMMLQGVEEHCRNVGYLVVYTNFQYHEQTPAHQLTLPKLLIDHHIADCVILVGMNYENLLNALDNVGIPYVCGGNKLVSSPDRARRDTVYWDDKAGAYTAVRYLLDLEHRRIAYIGDASLPWFRRPYEGYCDAMQEADLEPLTQTLALSTDPFENGRLSMELLLERDPSVTAVFADCNVLYGAWETCRKAQLHVPNDISLIALGEQYGMLNVPPITNVSYDMTLIGRTAAMMATEKIATGQKHLPEVVLPMMLVARGTCRHCSLMASAPRMAE